ncbi:hypothetical protein DFJ74DRAFT_448304 [Hyaloraphidium curvatum]|nr:hypothetical protein DFJ74DRAFT_448304 [Hyaloraphidium curvatum]
MPSEGARSPTRPDCTRRRDQSKSLSRTQPLPFELPDSTSPAHKAPSRPPYPSNSRPSHLQARAKPIPGSMAPPGPPTESHELAEVLMALRFGGSPPPPDAAAPAAEGGSDARTGGGKEEAEAMVGVVAGVGDVPRPSDGGFAGGERKDAETNAPPAGTKAIPGTVPDGAWCLGAVRDAALPGANDLTVFGIRVELADQAIAADPLAVRLAMFPKVLAWLAARMGAPDRLISADQGDQNRPSAVGRPGDWLLAAEEDLEAHWHKILAGTRASLLRLDPGLRLAQAKAIGLLSPLFLLGLPKGYRARLARFLYHAKKEAPQHGRTVAVERALLACKQGGAFLEAAGVPTAPMLQTDEKDAEDFLVRLMALCAMPEMEASEARNRALRLERPMIASLQLGFNPGESAIPDAEPAQHTALVAVQAPARPQETIGIFLMLDVQDADRLGFLLRPHTMKTGNRKPGRVTKHAKLMAQRRVPPPLSIQPCGLLRLRKAARRAARSITRELHGAGVGVSSVAIVDLAP